jgi:hypothetical protein
MRLFVTAGTNRLLPHPEPAQLVTAISQLLNTGGPPVAPKA